MLGHAAIGAWSGGRYLHFGEAIDEARLSALLHPDRDLHTVLTADVYGQGEGDALVGRALVGLPRGSFALVGAIGHDFVNGEREGPRGFPRFTDPRLRGPEGYRDYVRGAVERSLERCGVSSFDVLLLHNPDRHGFESPEVWEALREVRDEGLAGALGLAPGPANGFVLDLIGCLERFGELIDWAMVILGPLEPWPGELVLGACADHGVSVITRVVDYGGLFWDDVLPGHGLARDDHRAFRPGGWIEAGREKLDHMRPVGARHGLTPLQLACQWNLAHVPVRCVVPTLIQESGPGTRPIEDKRAELAELPSQVRLSESEVVELRAIGDNTGSMALKGASPDHEGDERPDRWGLGAEHVELAQRHGIDPDADLRQLIAR
ncbi:MAG: aldo/keto reductase [Actinomycetota bacterium]|nr:aldo/keto reductase [Actinomycetota bacterium]